MAQEVDGVIDLLRASGVTVRRWNLDQYPEYEQASFSSDGMFTFGNNKSGSESTIGWVHDTSQLSVLKSTEGLIRELALNDCWGFVQGVLQNLNCSWLNAPFAIQQASNKLFQLDIARRIGIPVPSYIVTNDLAKAKKFISDKEAVIKTISNGFTIYKKKYLKSYTQMAEKENIDLSRLFLYRPFILQRYIKKQIEYRVTVVGGKTYWSAIDLKDLSADCTDYRKMNFIENRWRFYKPEKIEKIDSWSIKLVDLLGLNYAGLDWIIDEHGNFFFLECNPLASFKWYEITTGNNISEAITKSLIALHRNDRRQT